MKIFIYMSIYQLIIISLMFFNLMDTAFPEDLSERVSKKLESVSIGEHEIDISNWRGDVTLKGKINSSNDQEKILEAVNSVKGVDKIIDLLEVGAASEATLAQYQSDKNVLDIQKKTDTFLKNLPIKGNYSLQYHTLGSKLLVTGELPAGTNKKLLLNYWEQMSGLRVQDRILVRPWPTDAELKSKIHSNLVSKQGLNLDGIEINVHEGVVSLSGKRANHYEADQLATAVWMVEGVRDFKSEITYKGNIDDAISVQQ